MRMTEKKETGLGRPGLQLALLGRWEWARIFKPVNSFWPIVGKNGQFESRRVRLFFLSTKTRCDRYP